VHFASLTKLLVLVALSDAGANGAPDDAAEKGEPSAPVASSQTREPPLPAVAFALERRPRATRTQAWTRQRRGFAPAWESAYPEQHFSRFLDLAMPTFHPPWVRAPSPEEWRRNLFRFAAAVSADLQRAIAAACPPGRCMPEMVEVASRLTAFVKAHLRDFTYVEQPSGATAFYAWHGWQITGGDTSFSVGCHEMVEAPEVSCRLEVALGDQLMLSYAPRNPYWPADPELTVLTGDDRGRVGEIQFDRTYDGAPVVIIGGIALATPHP
jgi:hypothetical protein